MVVILQSRPWPTFQNHLLFTKTKAERTIQDKKTRARRTYNIIMVLYNQGGAWDVSKDVLNLAGTETQDM